MLFNADGADGYPGHSGPTFRNGSREETTFGAIHSTTCCLAGGESPCSLLSQPRGDTATVTSWEGDMQERTKPELTLLPTEPTSGKLPSHFE